MAPPTPARRQPAQRSAGTGLPHAPAWRRSPFDFPTSALGHVAVAQLKLVSYTKEMATWTIPDQQGHAPLPRVLSSSSGSPESPSSLGCHGAQVPDVPRQNPPHSELTPLFICLFHHLLPGFSQIQSHLSQSGAAPSLCSPKLPTSPYPRPSGTPLCPARRLPSPLSRWGD